MNEIWKPIKNFEQSHLISNFGRVKSLSRKIPSKNNSFRISKEKILINNLLKNNYHSIQLCNKGKRFQIHRLVAQAFIPNPLNKPCVNHIDGNGLNNNVYNLEWVTYSENEKHSYDILGKKANINNLKNYSDDWDDILIFKGVKIRCSNRKLILKHLKSGLIISDLKDKIKPMPIYSFISELKRKGVNIKYELLPHPQGHDSRIKKYYIDYQ